MASSEAALPGPGHPLYVILCDGNPRHLTDFRLGVLGLGGHLLAGTPSLLPQTHSRLASGHPTPETFHMSDSAGRATGRAVQGTWLPRPDFLATLGLWVTLEAAPRSLPGSPSRSLAVILLQGRHLAVGFQIEG